MKQTKLTLFALISLTLFSVVKTSIDDFEAKNSHGQVEFRVVDGNRIKVLNNHHQKRPSLKLSLNGVKINQVKSINATEWQFMLNDDSSATFKLMEHANVTEYYFNWLGGKQNAKREVCFHYGFNDASWYNTYQSKSPSFPMNTNANVHKSPAIVVFDMDQPDISAIAEYLFVNSDGFAVFPEHNSPLFMRKAANEDDPILCFSVNNTAPYKTNSMNTSYLDIILRLFASENIRKVTDYVVNNSGLISTPKSIPDERKFTYPMWHVHRTNNGSEHVDEQTVMEFPKAIAHHGFPASGELHITNWDYDYSFNFNRKLYPHPDVMNTNVTTLGFRLILLASTRISPSFSHLKEYLVKGEESDRQHVDLSNPEAQKYFTLLLKKLHYEIGIDSFFLYENIFFQPNIKFKDEQVNLYPNLFVKNHVETVAVLGNSMTSLNAYRTQHLPTVLQLVPGSSNDLLKKLVQNSLSVSLGGYSFISPSLVTGQLRGAHQNIKEELYVRQVQALAFMPVMTFFEAPWYYSEKTLEITKKYVDLHVQHAPLIIELAKQRIKTGSPIIRPMWYDHTDDEKTFKIGDQFMLGENILVAPVVEIAKLERNVYFPAGNWVDQHGKVYVGPKAFKVAAPLDELPYFKKKV